MSHISCPFPGTEEVGTEIEGTARAACHNVACAADGTIFVQVGAGWFPCPSGGAPLFVPGYIGSLTCPEDNGLCTASDFGAGADVVTPSAWPTITSVTPQAGLPGTPVTIRGTGFSSLTTLTIEGEETAFTVTNDTMVVAVIPAELAVDSVRSAIFTASDADGFGTSKTGIYTLEAPVDSDSGSGTASAVDDLWDQIVAAVIEYWLYIVIGAGSLIVIFALYMCVKKLRSRKKVDVEKFGNPYDSDESEYYKRRSSRRDRPRRGGSRGQRGRRHGFVE